MLYKLNMNQKQHFNWNCVDINYKKINKLYEWNKHKFIH